MANNHESLQTEALPPIDDAVLAEMTGFYGLTQDRLWQVVGDANLGNLGSYALGEGDRLEKQGVSPRDAFGAGVGWVILALARQANRENTKKAVTDLWATASDAPVQEQA